MLFGSVADKTAVNLCRDTHHEPARIGAFRQRLWNRLAGCSQVGQRSLQVGRDQLSRFAIVHASVDSWV